MNILYEPQNWNFEIYEKTEDVKSNGPSIIIVAKKFPENHNSKFPYIPDAIYLAKNPETFLNRQPVFNKQENQVFLVLMQDQINLEHELISTIKQMKITFDCDTAYNNEGKRI